MKMVATLIAGFRNYPEQLLWLGSLLDPETHCHKMATIRLAARQAVGVAWRKPIEVALACQHVRAIRQAIPSAVSSRSAS